MFFEERNIFEEKLLLQVFRAGGNDHALARKDRGNQIGQRFAGSGSRFDNQMLFIGERGFDGLRHFELAVAIFVIRVPLGKQTSLAEESPDG